MNMNTLTTTPIALALAFGISFAAPVTANAPADKGFEIAARSDRSDVGFGDSRVELQMILRNAAGQESTRSLKIATLEKRRRQEPGTVRYAARHRRHRAAVARQDPRARRSVAVPAGAEAGQAHRL
jgi:hypothetical protein